MIIQLLFIFVWAILCPISQTFMNVYTVYWIDLNTADMAKPRWSADIADNLSVWPLISQTLKCLIVDFKGFSMIARGEVKYYYNECTKVPDAQCFITLIHSHWSQFFAKFDWFGVLTSRFDVYISRYDDFCATTTTTTTTTTTRTTTTRPITLPLRMRAG